MSHTRAKVFIVAAVLSWTILPAATQGPSLTVVSAGPRGEIAQLADADDIRVVFSEPMIALGAVPRSAPSWIHVTPAVPGSFYWSGTKTLIFSPDASTPLPFATAFTVRVDAAATSVAGKALSAPYEFSFTTPTPRLLDAHWQRKNGRFDSVAVIALRFNQPMQAADVAAHAHVSLTPHPWEAPAMSAEARARLRQTEPAGLADFDRKVAAVRRAASSSSPVAVRAADSWDEREFPVAPERVVLETIAAPPTEGWLTVALDDGLTGVQGRERHAPQSTVVKLEPTFFVMDPHCTVQCDPSSWMNSIELTRPVANAALARAVSVADVTQPANERPLPVAQPQRTERAHESSSINEWVLGLEPQPPTRTWRFHVDADLVAGDGQTLGYPWVGFIETAHRRPVIGLEGTVWEAGGGPLIPLTVLNVESIASSITRMTASSVMPRLDRDNWLPRLLLPVPNKAAHLTAPDAVQRRPLDVRRAVSNRGTGILHVAVSPRPPEREPLVVNVPDAMRAVIQVTNLGISVKDSPESTLVFVTRLDSAAPVPGAHVAIVDNRNRTRWRGTTDRDGVAVAPALALRDRLDSSLAFIVTAEKDGDEAFVQSNWSGDARPSAWGFRESRQKSSGVLRGRVFTDRGVYKANDTVHVKAVVRDDTPGGMRLLPEGTELEVVVHDGRHSEIDRRRVTANRWSSAEWTWSVPADGPLGHYSIDVTHAGAAAPDFNSRVAGYFLVAAYRRPDFRVDAKLTPDSAILGSTLSGTVDAKYLFGGPLGARPVRWSLRREPVQRVPDVVRERYPDARYAIGYRPDVDEQRPEQTVLPSKTDTLDTNGQLRVALATPRDDAAYSYTFEGDVEDVSGQHIANRASLVVHPASIYVAMSRPLTFVATTTGANVDVAVVDLAGAPVAGVPVTVSLVRVEWVPSSSGQRFERREVAAGTWMVRTGADGGDAPISIPVREGGFYTLRATARDSEGRQTRTETSLYALGPGASSWRTVGHRFELTSERSTWKPGETARLLIQSPWPRATALLTVEREGIRSYRTFTVTSTHDTVDVPISEGDIPNVYVSVLLVKGRTSTELDAGGEDVGQPSYRVGYAELTVDDASKRLRVDVSADRDEYKPREPITVSVQVAAPDGKPAPSDVTFWAIDYGLLSLTDYKTPDVLKAIYVPKPLGVITLDNRHRLLTRRRPPPQPLTAGIEGGVIGGVRGGVIDTSRATTIADTDDEGFDVPSPQDVEMRRDFRPLVFWLGSATTNADGRTTTTVTLPDSLTTYRIMAVAGDQASRFGYGEREFRVAKALTLLPAFPRFLTAGDRASFGAVVTNSSTTAGDAVVTIESLDPQTLQFSGVATQTLRLAPSASASVKFEALARATGDARVRVIARMGVDSDGLELPLVVSTRLLPETTSAYGETTSTAIERLVLPAGVSRGAGGLTIDLASTALVGLSESARYLEQYPYECAEQKASRALALSLAADLGGAFTLSKVRPAEYRNAAVRAVSSLYPHQCSSGGFALWAGTCRTESPYLTAYVLHAFKVAETLEIPVDAIVVERALDYLEGQLGPRPPEVQHWPIWGASSAYAVKMLTEFGRKPDAEIERLVGAAEHLPVFALSYLADALAATNDDGPRYQNVVRRLTNAIRLEADRAHVEEIDESSLMWLWNSNVRATAVVLDGFARRKENAAIAAPLVRWLVAAQRDSRWATTHENAMALEALVTYYRAFESDVPRMTATVTLGSATVGRAEFNGRSTAAQQIRMPMPDLLARVTTGTADSLSISRAGTGRVYYTARVQSFAPEPPDAVDRGVHVERRYARYVKDAANPSTASFTAGDLVRVTVAVTLRGEGRYLALTDPLPAGFEPLEGWFETTARDLAREATRTSADGDWWTTWRRGDFDHVEKHDDRVVAFATRLGSGRHEFSYLVRATTSGTFTVAGARVEAMYAPEFNGRSEAASITVR